MYQTNLSHFQNYPKDLGVSRGMELRDIGHYQFGLTRQAYFVDKILRYSETYPCHKSLPKLN